MSEIKKKFIDADQIDGLKLLFLNAQFLRFRNAANLANIDWTKFDTDDIAKILSKTFYNQTVLGADPKELVNVEYLNAVIGSIPSGSIGPWTAWTPSFTGFGTVTNINMRYRTVGLDSIEITGEFQVGSPTGAVASMSLPSPYAAAANYSSNNPVVGHATHNIATTYFFSLVANPSDTNLYFGAIANTVFISNSKRTGTDLVGAGEIIFIPATTIRI